MSAQPMPTTLAPGQWSHVLDKLIDAGLLTKVDPLLHVSELCQSRGLTQDEFEIVKKQRTSSLRMQNLTVFIRRRPSMASHLQAILVSHAPLLEVMKRAVVSWYDVLCEDAERFRAALHNLHKDLDIVGEWAGPRLLRNGCLSETEANELANGKRSLSGILTAADKSSECWRRFLDFLGQEQPDLLLFVDRAFNPHGVESTTEDRMRPPSKMETRWFQLWNDRTDAGAHVSNQSFSVPDRGSVRELREAVARWLGVSSRTVVLSCRFVRVDGVAMMVVRDVGRGGAGFVVAEGAERPWSEAKWLPSWWRELEDAEPIPFTPGRRPVLRASSAPLREFDVENEIRDYFGGKGFRQSFPLRERGLVGELKAAIRRHMELPAADIVLSRRVAQHRGVEKYRVKKDDDLFFYFCDVHGQSKVEENHVTWTWETLKDAEEFPFIPHWRNCIRVSRR